MNESNQRTKESQKELDYHLDQVKANRFESLLFFSELLESYLLNETTDLEGAEKLKFQNFSDSIKKIIKNA